MASLIFKKILRLKTVGLITLSSGSGIRLSYNQAQLLALVAFLIRRTRTRLSSSTARITLIVMITPDIMVKPLVNIV